MQSIDHSWAFAEWWANTFPGTQCPPLPKKRGDLGLTAEMALQSDNPALFQNLFGNGGLGSGSMACLTFDLWPCKRGKRGMAAHPYPRVSKRWRRTFQLVDDVSICRVVDQDTVPYRNHHMRPICIHRGLRSQPRLFPAGGRLL